MFLYLALLVLVNGHNWINGLSRAGGDRNQASKRSPAPPRSGPGAHRKVGVGQDFVIEWATGHRFSTYWFVVLKAENEDKIRQHNSNLLQDYINNAPDSAKKYQAKKYWKIHVSCTFKNQGKHAKGRTKDCPTDKYNDGKSYQRQIPEGDEMYIDREKFKREKINSWEYVQFEHKETERAEDRRVEYKSAKYPWIESVHKFKMGNYPFAREWQSARFALGREFGSGQYIVHMIWRVYRDIIDVNVLPTDAKDIYGTAGTERWVKIEHCQYPNYDSHKDNQCFFVKNGDVSACLAECLRRGTDNCDAVNVVPLYTPSDVPDYVRGKRAKDAAVIWNSNKCSVPADNEHDKNTFVCYGLKAKDPKDKAFNPEAETRFYTRDNDAEDPIFYSTCFHREKGRKFDDNPPCPKCGDSGSQMSLVTWRVGGKCLSCADMEASQKMSSETVFQWQTKEVCEKCDA